MFFTERKQVIKYLLIMTAKALFAATIAVVVCYYVGNKIATISKNIYVQKKLIFLLKQKQNNQQALRKSYGELETMMPKLQTALPQDDTVDEFLSNIDTISKEQGLTTTLKFNPPTPSPDSEQSFPINLLTYTIVTSGNITTITNFIKALEAMPFANTINSMAMNSPATSQGWNENSSVTIQGQLYTRATQTYEPNQ